MMFYNLQVIVKKYQSRSSMKKLIISRKDLKNNLKIIQKRLNSFGKDDGGNNKKIIAVVKGNGMGLGLVQYSKFLVKHGIDFLAVANLEEATTLRQAGITEEILMLTPISKESELEKLIQQKITLTISTKEQIELIEKIGQNQENEIKAHIKIDTGFGRYGFLSTNLKDILDAFKMCDKLKLCGMYTHFARPMADNFTNKQFDRFLEVVKFLKKEGQDVGMLHCSESTAFLKYPMMHLNAVRIGSLLQGRTLVHKASFIPIGQFKSSIQEIKTVPKGYNISYGNMYKTKRETKIAILPVGFMDGLNMRKDRDIFSLKENFLSVGIEIKKFFKDNRLKVLIKDKKYSIIGRIGMYHAVVDITDGEAISIDDEVILEIPPMQVSSMIRREYV